MSRSSYAMFYAARALLLTHDIRRSKHSGVIAAFGPDIVRSGAVPAELLACLRDGFDSRAESDYGLVMISEEQARRSLGDATPSVREVAPLVAAALGGGDRG